MVLDHTEEHGSQWATIYSIAGKLGMTSGTIVGKVRDTGAAHPLFGVVEDMDEINVYTRRTITVTMRTWNKNQLARPNSTGS
jgi:hypothetical protein